MKNKKNCQKSDKHELLLDTIDTQVWYLTDIETYGAVNRAHAEFLGASKGEIEYKRLDEFLPPEVAKICKKGNAEVFESKKNIHTEEIMKDSAGRERVLAITKTPRLSKNGGVEYIVCTGTDITDRKRTEKLFKIQRDIALDMNFSKSLKENLGRLLDHALRIESIDSGGVYLVDEITGGIDLVAHKGLSPEFINEICHYDKGAAQTKLMKKGKPVYGEYRNLLCFRPGEKNSEGFLAVAIIPIFFEGKVIALMNLASHTHKSIPSEARLSIETVASLIGGLTRRIKAENEEYRQKQNFETLFNTLDDFLFILDEKGQAVKVNEVVKTRLGYGEAELAKMNVLDFHSPERKAEAISIVEDVLAGRREYCTIPLMTREGTLIPVETKVTPGIWDNKKAFFGISRDISKRKKAEQKLKESEERLKFVIEGTNVGFWDWNVQTGETVYNRRWAEIIGYTLEELEPVNIETWRGLTHPEDLKLSEKILEKIFAGEKEYFDYDFRMMHKNGEWVWIHGRGKVVEWDREGQALRMAGTHEDISLRKQMEDKLFRYRMELEKKVDERTGELKKSNRELQLEIKRREKSEKRLADSLKIKEAIAYMSSLLVDFAELDVAIKECLFIMGNITGADGVCLVQIKNSGGNKGDMLVNTHEWEGWEGARGGSDEELPPALPADLFPGGMEKLHSNEIIHITDVAELSEKYSAEKELLQAQNVESLIVLPLREGKKLTGFIRLNNVTEKGECKDENLDMLHTMGNMLSKALEKERYKKQLNSRYKIQKAINEIQSFLLNPSEIDEALFESLFVLGILTDASRAYIFLLKHDGEIMDNTHEWCAPGVEAQKENLQDLPSEMFPWWMKKLRSNEIIHITDVERMPEEASAEKEILQFQDIKSLIVLPIWGGKELAGFVGLDNVVKTGIWEEEDVSTLLMVTDIIGRTLKQKKMEQALIRANLIADAGRRTQEEFMWNMNHELHTPLNSIIGFSEVLAMNTKANLDDKQLRYVNNISTSGKKLLEIIDRLLEYSNIKYGREDFDPAYFELRLVFEDLQKMLAPSLRTKKIRLDINLGEQVVMVYADKSKFVQILYNLISNAINYSPDGSNVTVNVRSKGGFLEVSVLDKGKGIKKEKVPFIFDPFKQTENFMTKKQSGTGLGLTLVKHYVDMHGGNIWVKSEEGKGSTFTFTIPKNLHSLKTSPS